MSAERDLRPRQGGGASLLAGAGVALAALAVTTLLLYPLADVAPVESLGVAYLVAVLLVSSLWGAPLGIATAVAGAAAFSFFHIPPTGRFTVSEGENWVASTSSPRSTSSTWRA
jgi:two-component system sensor histidine kinase KdpD